MSAVGWGAAAGYPVVAKEFANSSITSAHAAMISGDPAVPRSDTWAEHPQKEQKQALPMRLS